LSEHISDQVISQSAEHSAVFIYVAQLSEATPATEISIWAVIGNVFLIVLGIEHVAGSVPMTYHHRTLHRLEICDLS